MRISFTSTLFRAVGTAVVVTTVVLTTWGALRQAATPLAPEWDADPSIGLLLEALEGRVEPGDTLAVLSPNMASGFPLTNYLGTVWPLRLNTIWPAVTEYREQLDSGEAQVVRPLPDATPLEHRVLDVVAQDLKAGTPEWLLLFRHIEHPEAPYMSRVRIREFLARSTSVASVLGRYDSLAVVGLYSVWRRRDDDRARGPE